MAERIDRCKLTFEEQRTLDLCIKIEKKCALLYRHFEILYQDMPKLASLWQAIASEEDNHAEAFRIAARLKGVGMDSIQSTEGDIAFLKKVERVLDLDVPPSPSPSQALSFAITLEKDVNEFHVQAVLHFDDAVLKKAFCDNMAFTKEHVSMLEDALADFDSRSHELN